MNLLQKCWNRIQKSANSTPRRTGVDNLTKSVAVAISRRGFLKKVLAGTTTLGLTFSLSDLRQQQVAATVQGAVVVTRL